MAICASRPIRFAGYFDYQYVCKESIDTLDFLHGYNHQRMEGSMFTFGWDGQFCFLSNQIAGFLDHQYLWKESIETLDFLHGSNYQGKEGAETTLFG